MNDRIPPYRKPTPAEFEAARRAAAQEDALLEVVSEAFIEKFGPVARIDEFMLLPQIDVGFRAYIFFEKDEEVTACQSSALKEEMREFLTTQLIALGDKDEDLLALEIDSYENVIRHFEGSYFLRMRSGQVQERGRRQL